MRWVYYIQKTYLVFANSALNTYPKSAYTICERLSENLREKLSIIACLIIFCTGLCAG